MAVSLGVKDKEDLTPTTSFAPQVEFPYIGKAQLLEVHMNGIKTKAGAEYNTLTFVFSLHGDEETGGKTKKGMQYVHQEWEPKDPNGDEKKEKTLENQIKRIAYICKYWLGEENAIKATTVTGEDLAAAWEALRKKVVLYFSKLKEKRDYTQKVVDIKITGSVDNSGNPRLNFTPYLGFIADAESEFPLTFSRGEKDANAQYMAAYGKRNASASSASGSVDIGNISDDADIQF